MLAADDFLGLIIDPRRDLRVGVVGGPSAARGDASRLPPPSTRSMSIEEVIELLDTDPARSSKDHDSFAEFVQEIQDTAVSQLNGTAFRRPDRS